VPSSVTEVCDQSTQAPIDSVFSHSKVKSNSMTSAPIRFSGS